jgi:hypothetical protein
VIVIDEQSRGFDLVDADEGLDLAEFVADDAFVLIDDCEFQHLLDEAIQKARSEAKLAKSLGISRGRVYDLRMCRVPPRIRDMKALSEYLGTPLHSLPINGLSTRKGGILKINWRVEVTPELAWLLGIRLGDRDEDHYSIGVGTSDIEIAREFVDSCSRIFEPSGNAIHCIASVPEPFHLSGLRAQLANTLRISDNNVRLRRPHQTQRHKMLHLSVRMNNSVASNLLRKIDHNLKQILLRSTTAAKCAFVRGVIDSDGRIRESGSVEIEMRAKNTQELETVRETLLSLEMDVSQLHKRINRDTTSLTIYATKSNKEFMFTRIKSTLPRKMLRIEKALSHPGKGLGFLGNASSAEG